MKLNSSVLLCGSVFLMLIGTQHAYAQYTNFNVSINTSGLPTLSSGDNYNLDFQLNGSNGSEVTLNNFQLGGGSITGTPQLTDAVTGSIDTGSIILGPTSLSNPFNEYDEGFVPGNRTLSFDVNFNPVMTGSTPDNFVFGLYDSNGAFSTTGPDGFELATLDLTKTNFASSDWNVYSYMNASNGNITTSVTSLSGAPPVPESGSLKGFGMLMIASLFRLGKFRLREFHDKKECMV